MSCEIITYKIEQTTSMEVFLMKLAAADAFYLLWNHYAAIELWIKSGRVDQKPSIPSYYE